MTGLPTVQVLLDDGTGTFPYDITGKSSLKAGYTGKRGRQDEFSQVTPGDLGLTLDNNDGRFTPGSTIIASPSPIKLDAKVRVKLTANGTTVNRYTMFLQSLPVEWPGGSDLESRVRMTAFDVQSKGERRPLKSVIEEEISEDSPAAYYTLGEPEGATSAADSSGNQAAALTQAGSGAVVVFGTDTGPGTDGLTAATFAGGKYLAGTNPNALATTECWFATTTGTSQIIIADIANSIGFFVDGATGTLFRGGGATSASLGTPVVNDGLIHHLAWQSGQVTLDGTVYTSGSIPAPPSTVALGALPGNSWSAGNFVGSMAHLAMYTSTLSGARITAHYQAGSTGFAGESGTTRITRTAGYANLPVGTLDASLTNVAFVDITGKSASEAMLQVADAEMGLVFVDGSGNLAFHNRNRPVAKTAPDVTITANQLSEDTAFVTDMQGVINYFETTAEGTKVTQVVRNLASEVTNQHGRYPGSATYLVQTDAEALDRANWIVGNHAEPQARAGTLKVDLLTSMTAAEQATWLAVEPNHWIRVTGLPSQTPGGTTADLMVQGWSETVSGDEWTLTLNVVARAMFQAWILGDATYGVLDSTTRLGV